MATDSSILAWRIPWIGNLEGYSPWGEKELDMTERLSHTHSHLKLGTKGAKSDFNILRRDCVLLLSV